MTRGSGQSKFRLKLLGKQWYNRVDDGPGTVFGHNQEAFVMTGFQWLEEYLGDMPGVTKDYKLEWGWDRYMVGGKLFAATCRPSGKYAAEYAGHPLLTLKCDPLESEALRSRYPDILPGFYTDKRTWISVRLDGTVPEEMVRHLSDASYRLVFSKLTKKLQREISGRDTAGN